MTCLIGSDKKVWQRNCIRLFTMKNNNFEYITDAYQLVEGAKIKGKKQEEIFELGAYDPNKRGYTVFPFEEGIKYNDFSVLMSEKELMNNYLIENSKVNKLAA
jgi:hypothetical protein